jgi:DNA adenine methylase Dam
VLPPLRWVGSKRKYAADLAARCNAHRGLHLRHIEPFLGSGAVALATPNDTPMILADACVPLGYLWWWIQREPEAVAEYAAGYGVLMNNTTWNTRDGYKALRKEHNAEPYADDGYQPSARFLWLMAANFNGIYRENKLGQYNVPWGARAHVSLPSAADLRAIADHIACADIRPGWDFEDVMAEAGDGDVVFSDPPYDGDKSAFTSYVKKPFTADEQVRLRDVSVLAVERGATVIMTNADTPRIRDLYQGWQIEEMVEARPVAAAPRDRKPAHCLIVTLTPYQGRPW